MPRHLPFAILALLLTALPLRADKAEDAVIALAVSRAKAELALKNAQNATDPRRSNWESTWQLTELLRNKTYSALEGRQQAEEKNVEEARNTALVNQIEARLKKLRDDWDTYNAKDRPALALAFQDAADTVAHLAQALDNLAAAEKAWKEANLDPATLQSAYDAITRRAAEMQSQAEKSTAAAKAKQKEIQADLDDANAFLGRAK